MVARLKPKPPPIDVTGKDPYAVWRTYGKPGDYSLYQVLSDPCRLILDSSIKGERENLSKSARQELKKQRARKRELDKEFANA